MSEVNGAPEPGMQLPERVEKGDLLLSVQNLRTHFRVRDGIVRAVDGVSYAIERGKTLGLVGESGCGKSVSALSVMRLIRAPGDIVGGEVMWQDRDLRGLSDREMRRVRGDEISMIFQEPMTALNPVFNTGNQIGEVLREHRDFSRKQRYERTIEVLRLVGIPQPEQRVKAYPHELSGGMRQRVMIAMGLSCNPQLLIADEPTTALDVTIQAQIIDLVDRLRKELGMAIIWITHDLGVVAGMAERVIVMYSGFIIEAATVNDLYAQPHHPYTLGLLRSIPRLDEAHKERLVPIDGLPPDLLDEPSHCPFAPRCEFVIEKCWQENPPLETVADDHLSACWRDISEIRLELDAAAGGAA
jgi:oligopeptide transport system ATP-binding protein